MKKTRSVSLEGILDSMEAKETLEDKLLKDLPLHKKFSMPLICEYYDVTHGSLYKVIQRMVKNGTLEKSRGRFNGRNNVLLFERVK